MDSEIAFAAGRTTAPPSVHTAPSVEGVQEKVNDAREGLPPTSLIVASRNRPDLLIESVRSILAGEELPSELLIVDQSDTPNPALQSLTIDGGCHVRYLWTQTRGLSRANNYGISQAREEIIVFTHDDVLASPAWFGALVRALVKGGRRSIVTGQVRPTEPTEPGAFAPTVQTSPEPAMYEGRVGADVLIPINMAMYRSAVEEVGGFDERLGPGTPFPGAEDNDLGFRLLESGYRIIYVPEAVIWHRAWRNASDYFALRWSYAVAQGGFYAKNLNWRDRYIIGRAAGEVRRRLSRLPARVRWRELRMGLGDLVYLAGLGWGAGEWLLRYRGTR